MFKQLKEKAWEQGALYMVYSSLFLSLLNISVKASVGSLGSIAVTFLRCFSPFVLLILIITWRKEWHQLRSELGISMHLLRSLCAVLGQLSLSYYLTRGSLADGTMLWATGPIYVPILTQIFFRQKTPLITWISIFICLIGVGMMIKPTDGIFDPFSIWGIFAGILTAFSQILWGRNIEKGSITENMFYLYFFTSLFALLIWIIFGSQGSEMHINLGTVAVSIVIMALASLGNQLFRSKAYQKAPPYLLTPILYVSVIGAAVLDVIFYHRWPDTLEYLGFAFVIGGTLLKWYYLKKIGNQLS